MTRFKLSLLSICFLLLGIFSSNSLQAANDPAYQKWSGSAIIANNSNALVIQDNKWPNSDGSGTGYDDFENERCLNLVNLKVNLDHFAPFSRAFVVPWS